jgi:hypothetical protein
MAVIKKSHFRSAYPKRYASKHHSDKLARLSFRVEFVIVLLAGISSLAAVIYAFIGGKGILNDPLSSMSLSDWAVKALLIIGPSLCGFITGLIFAREKSLSRK